MPRESLLLSAVRQWLAEDRYRARPSDELLELFRRTRDAAAFRGLVQRFGGLVWRRCQSVLPRHDLAEEAFQETFLALAVQGHRIARPAALGSWLGRVASRQAANIRRRERRRFAEPLADAVAPPDNEPGAGDDRALMACRLAELPERYRLPLELVYFDGKTHAEAALALNWPKGTVDSNISRGLTKLRAAFGGRDLTLTAAGVATLPPGLASATAQAAAAAPTPGPWAGLLAMLGAKLTHWPALAAGVALTAALAGAGLYWARPPARPDPPPVVLAETLPQENLRLLHERVLPDLTRELAPLALGGGEVVVLEAHAHDSRVRVLVELRHKLALKPGWRSRLWLLHDTHDRFTGLDFDTNADGTWIQLDTTRTVVLGRLKPLNVELKLNLDPITRATALLATLPADERAASEAAAHLQRFRAAVAPLCGVWVNVSDANELWEGCFNPPTGRLEFGRRPDGGFAFVSPRVCWPRPDGTFHIPPVELRWQTAELSLTGDRLTWGKQGTVWRRP